MAAIREMTTTAFRLTDALLGSVHVYRAGEHLAAAWERASRQQAARRPGAQLPFRSLVAALRIHSGDFVVMQRWIGDDASWIVSRQRLDMEWLQALLQAWEVVVLGDDQPGRISRHLEDLRESSIEVASLVMRRPGQPPRLMGGQWAWEAARWEVAHRLAARPLTIENRQIPLRLDSEARLLTWDDRVPQDPEATCQAMHRIEAKVMTLPGVEEPVIGLSSSLSRLATRWYSARRAWVDLGQDVPLLHADVRKHKTETGWQTEWQDRAATLLQTISLSPLPAPGERPTLAGQVRATYAQPKPGLPVGKGVGPWFHDAVARHGYRSLEGAVPIVLERVGKASFPAREGLAPRHVIGWTPLDESETPQVRLCLLYASAGERLRLRLRLEDLVTRQLTGERPTIAEQRLERLTALEDGEWCRLGPLEVIFLSPPGAPRHLLEATSRQALSSWLNDWWPDRLAFGDATPAFVVETLTAAARENIAKGQDPKPLLRELLAARGAVSQFVAADSAPSASRRGRQAPAEDHAGKNALIDLLRSAGCFLRAFPAYEVMPGTLLVGIYTLDSRKGEKAHKGFYTNLVACVAGSAEAYGYLSDAGWCPLGEATARYMLSKPLPDKGAAAGAIRRAVEQLRVRHPGVPVMLFFDALGNRRLFPCLTDRGEGHPESWMTEDGTAVVRVRSEPDEVPRVAGRGNWREEPSPATSGAFRPMEIQQSHGTSATYLVSGSAVQERNRHARQGSRFHADQSALREDWHSLGVTELWVMEAGRFGRKAVLAESLALCRGAPTWKRALRWPVPLHLARAIVTDLPARST